MPLQVANGAVQAHHVRQKIQIMRDDESGGAPHIFGITQRLSVTKLQPHQNSSQLKDILDPIKEIRDKLARCHILASTIPSERRCQALPAS